MAQPLKNMDNETVHHKKLQPLPFSKGLSKAWH